MKLNYFSGDLGGTFSIIARCPETLALGVSVSSASIAVGSAVPHVEPDVGAIAVQGYTNFFHGVNGLRLLRSGLPPETVISILLECDQLREKRQISIVDSLGRKAAFTGGETLEWRGHIIGRDCVAAGNALISKEVLEAMVDEFEKSEGEWLAERLIRALEAGQEAGGDRRGHRSAALLVAEREPIHESRPIINLRVDLDREPIRKLRKIFEAYKRWLRLIR
ncbi:MAG: DUF1028 domain-containing protein [Candidatus Bathyarchaeia archaeon]